jgi:copper homeostasis protein (lipoprotein)
MRHPIGLVLAISLMLFGTGCGDRGPGSAPSLPVDASALTGSYSGSFPCANCPAVDVSLWLRSDHIFFMRQDYQSADSSPADRVQSLGVWSWNSDQRTLVLEGRGPERRFLYSEDDQLVFQTLSELPHVLARQNFGAPFSDSIVLEGEFSSGGEISTFRECLTGMSLVVQDNTVGRDIRRQHRRMSAPDIHAIATLRGRLQYQDPLNWENAGLVAEQLVSFKPKTRCPE